MSTLYYAPGTVALAVHITLEELGVPYDTERLDFRAGEQRGAPYLAKNPKGRVPLLSTPQGDLTETLAILAYLADSQPGAGLLPADPFDRARALSFMTYLASTVHVNHAHLMRGSRWTDDAEAQKALAAKVPQTMRESFQLIEDSLIAGPWVLGEGYSVCDPYLFTIGRWLKGDGVEIADFPKVAAHHAAMRERPAVQAVLPLHGG